MDAEIVIAADAVGVAREAAQRFVDLAREAVAARGRFSVALSGGSTPGVLYGMLVEEPYRTQIPWHGVYLFWADERCVPPDDAGSNYRLAIEKLIAHVPIPEDNVCRVRGELEPNTAARAYEHALVDFFCGPYPRFDLVLLGLGTDGHTASLFPGSSVLAERERLTAAVVAHYEGRPAHRVTLTLPVINAARQVLFLVVGDAKADIVRTVLEESKGQLPAQRVRLTAGQLTWLLDVAAAGQLAG